MQDLVATVLITFPKKSIVLFKSALMFCLSIGEELRLQIPFCIHPWRKILVGDKL